MRKALVTAQTFAFGCKQKEEPQNALSSITRPVEIISDQKVGRSSVNNQSTFVDSAAGGRLAQVGLDKSNRKMATQSFCTMFLSGLQDVLFLGLSLLFFPLLRSLRRVWWDKPPDAWVAKADASRNNPGPRLYKWSGEQVNKSKKQFG
ncbi:hypothetical protein TESG_03184 [Trichophyton tonsurans CBS 112818]|uniref:Uncharacterized protein n=1 Tax=Trichophyton tonsurans (strain CBS 112818) TaxID=647933 RepID=F2RW93_TRIT1|nr:hypothetical protein TESG_03184 [Trichophyton tonsurans CBS 112818]